MSSRAGALPTSFRMTAAHASSASGTLASPVRGPAVLELSTNPGREHGPVDLTDLVLEPDEGMILRWRT